ncbi:MAG: hypothetical protein LC659_05505 [Myxococcales bacterium]|nr:hypothetical protein [Myxococcales bacterium]
MFESRWGHRSSMWDLLLVAFAKLVTALAQPALRWRARSEGPRKRRRIAAMATTPIGEARAGLRVRVAGSVEPAQSRSGAFFVADGDGSRALVQPASAAGVWASDGSALESVAAGDHVDVVGVARLPDPAVDRELAGDGAREARLVFAGSEAEPLFVIARR